MRCITGKGKVLVSVHLLLMLYVDINKENNNDNNNMGIYSAPVSSQYTFISGAFLHTLSKTIRIHIIRNK